MAGIEEGTQGDRGVERRTLRLKAPSEVDMKVKEEGQAGGGTGAEEMIIVAQRLYRKVRKAQLVMPLPLCIASRLLIFLDLRPRAFFTCISLQAGSPGSTPQRTLRCRYRASRTSSCHRSTAGAVHPGCNVRM